MITGPFQIQIVTTAPSHLQGLAAACSELSGIVQLALLEAGADPAVLDALEALDAGRELLARAAGGERVGVEELLSAGAGIRAARERLE